MIDTLLDEKKRREEFFKKLLGAVSLAYEIVDYNNISYTESAKASYLYKYLATILNEKDNNTFRRVVKRFLIEQDLTKPGKFCGRIWFKGLKPKDPKENAAIVSKILEQHYKDRKNYSERQKKCTERRKHYPGDFI